MKKIPFKLIVLLAGIAFIFSLYSFNKLDEMWLTALTTASLVVGAFYVFPTKAEQ